MPTAQISTVTYLTGAGGAPTLVLERRSGFDGTVEGGAIAGGALCFPAAGRHLSFDGRLLHAAPRDLAAPQSVPPSVAEAVPETTGAVGPRGAVDTAGSRSTTTTSTTTTNTTTSTSGGGGGLRVTFLVNVWLQHRPTGIHPFPGALVASLSGPTPGLAAASLFPASARRTPAAPPSLPVFPGAAPSSGPGAAAAPPAPGRRLAYPLSLAGKQHQAVLWLPGGLELGEAERLGAVALRLAAAAAVGEGAGAGGEGGSESLRAWVEDARQSEGGGGEGGGGARLAENRQEGNEAPSEAGRASGRAAKAPRLG